MVNKPAVVDPVLSTVSLKVGLAFSLLMTIPCCVIGVAQAVVLLVAPRVMVV